MYRTNAENPDADRTFTPEERALIARFGARRRGDGAAVWAVYLLAPSAFALYGIYRSDLVAVASGYFVLATMALFYLSRARGVGEAIGSILSKYRDRADELEARVAELEKRDGRGDGDARS